MKACIKCKTEKPLSDYYKHKQMKDGHINKCKECCKRESTRNREYNIDHYREYDRKRGNRQKEGYLKEYREKYPNKYKAHTMVNNAIRDGKMYSEGCENCGADGDTHGHHDDYLKPLNVRWLCAACHHQWHAKHGEALNP